MSRQSFRHVFSFDYVIKEIMVNVPVVQPSKEGLQSTQEARVALGYASSNSYASFVLSNLPRASITRWLHAARLPSSVLIFNQSEVRSCLQHFSRARRRYIRGNHRQLECFSVKNAVFCQ